MGDLASIGSITYRMDTEVLNRAGQSDRQAEVSVEDALDALRLVPEARFHLDSCEVRLIEEMRDRGWSWKQLGAAYGDRTAQAMQQQYKRRGGKRSWPTRRPAPTS